MNINSSHHAYMPMHAMSHSSMVQAKDRSHEPVEKLVQPQQEVTRDHHPARKEEGDTFGSVRREEMERFRIEMRALHSEQKEVFKEDKADLVAELRAEGADARTIRREVRELRNEFKEDFRELKQERRDELKEELNALGEDIKGLRQQFKEEFSEARREYIEESRENGHFGGLGETIRGLRRDFRDQFVEARQERIDQFRNDNELGQVPVTAPLEPEVVEEPEVTPDPVDVNQQVTSSQVAFNALQEGEYAITEMEAMVGNAADGDHFDANQYASMQDDLYGALQTYQGYVDSVGDGSTNLQAQLEEMNFFGFDPFAKNVDMDQALILMDDAAGLVSEEMSRYANAEELAAAYTGTVASVEPAAATENSPIVMDAETAQNIINQLTEQLASSEGAVEVQANVSAAGVLSML